MIIANNTEDWFLNLFSRTTNLNFNLLQTDVFWSTTVHSETQNGKTRTKLTSSYSQKCPQCLKAMCMQAHTYIQWQCWVIITLLICFIHICFLLKLIYIVFWGQDIYFLIWQSKDNTLTNPNPKKQCLWPLEQIEIMTIY